MEPETGSVSVTPAPPGVPPTSKVRFVFFNDRGMRAGWRFLVFVGIFLVIAFVLLAAFGLVLYALYGTAARGVASSGSPWLLGFSELVQFVPAVLAAWIMSRLEHRPMGVYGLPLQRSAISRFVAGYVVWGFLPLTVVLLIMRTLGVFSFGSPGLPLASALRWAVIWGVGFLLVGLAEEYVFRGYTLYTLADGIGFWPATVIMVLLFGLVHMGNGGETYIGIVGTILFALFASATLWRTGNLWLAVGAHAGWDWGQSYFYGVNDSGIQAQGHLFNPPPPHGAVWLSGGTVGPEGSIVTLIVWGLMFLGFLIFYKPRRGPAEAAQRAVAQG